MKRKLSVLVILVIVLGLLFTLTFESNSTTPFRFSQFVSSFKPSSLKENSQQQQEVMDSEKSDSKSKDEVLLQWVMNESKNIEASSVNPDLSEKMYREKVKQLSIEEIYKIQQVALDSERPANEKIFASYLLSLTTETAYLEPLEEFVLTSLKQRGEVRPHTQDELERSQELALKYMQIDSLYEKAMSKDKMALESLKKIARLSDIDQIRLYAQQKLALIR